MNIISLKKKIFTRGRSFEPLALEVFQFQAEHILLYRKYLEYLNINRHAVKKVDQIPFLPVELFKNHTILTEGRRPELYFESSGTTGMELSRHYVADIEVYRSAILQGFENMYGSPAQYVFLCLLPSYAEREHSSLVYMMNYLAEQSGNGDAGWYLYNHDELNDKITALQKTGNKKIFLLGVTFALLDFAEKFQPDLSNAVVMETGGMKGRRKEMIREEMHALLMQAFNLTAVHSEYGMTEMLSQGYSTKEGIFNCAPTMHILVRDVNDPFSYLPDGQTGGINMIDLANIYSCSFLELKDLGRITGPNQFEVLGRFDNSDIRGCSLLYS